MLCCRADVSENEARYITRRIEKEVTAKIENVLVRFCSDIPREWFPIIQKVYIQAENHEFNSIEEVIEKIASEGKQAGLISATDAALTLKYAPMYKT